MKKMNLYKVLMITAVALQAVLGIIFSIFGIILENELYVEVENFFLHFMFVPGVTMLLCLLHYKLFKTYQKKMEFYKTSAFIAFCICLTGQVLVIIYNMFIPTWIAMTVWYALCAVITAGIVFGLNILYVVGYLANEKDKSEV